MVRFALILVRSGQVVLFLLEFVSEATTKPHYVFGGNSMGPNFWPFNLWYARFEGKPEKLRMQQMKVCAFLSPFEVNSERC